MTMEDRMTRLKAREIELESQINAAGCWGAAVAAMGEELRGVRRAIAAEEAKK